MDLINIGNNGRHSELGVLHNYRGQIRRIPGNSPTFTDSDPLVLFKDIAIH